MSIDIAHINPNCPSTYFGIFEPLVKLWQSKPKSNGKPYWRDFKFQEFKGWHSGIMLADVVYPFNLNYRICGEMATQVMGVDMKGRLFSEIFTIKPPDENLSIMEKIVSTPCLGVISGLVPHDDRLFMKFHSLDLPLLNDEGGDMYMHILASKEGNSAPLLASAEAKPFIVNTYNIDFECDETLA